MSRLNLHNSMEVVRLMGSACPGFHGHCLLLNSTRTVSMSSSRAAAPVRGPMVNISETTSCNGTGRQDRRIPEEADAAGARQSFGRARATGSLRRRDASVRRDPGEIARRIPPGWVYSKSPRQSPAVFLRAVGAVAHRGRSGACQFRPDIAWFAVTNLGMDQPGSAADD